MHLSENVSCLRVRETLQRQRDYKKTDSSGRGRTGKEQQVKERKAACF